MRANELLAETRTPDGAALTLVRQSGRLQVQVNGIILMSSHVHGSEEAMAHISCAPLHDKVRATVLVGGLGMGYTLRATLDALGSDAEVTVSELHPALVEWNRGVLGPLAGHPLADPRVKLVEGDVAALLRASPGAFDVVLLDVDNGPEAFTSLKCVTCAGAMFGLPGAGFSVGARAGGAARRDGERAGAAQEGLAARALCWAFEAGLRVLSRPGRQSSASSSRRTLPGPPGRTRAPCLTASRLQRALPPSRGTSR